MESTRVQKVRFMVCADEDGYEFVGVTIADKKGVLQSPPGFVRWVGDTHEVELQNGIPDSPSDLLH